MGPDKTLTVGSRRPSVLFAPTTMTEETIPIWCERCNEPVRLEAKTGSGRLVGTCACGTERNLKIDAVLPEEWSPHE